MEGYHPIMIVQKALLKRKSVRAYLDKTVSKEQIENILNLAKHAPSGVNTQPWKVAVVMGEKKRDLEELRKRLIKVIQSMKPRS